MTDLELRMWAAEQARHFVSDASQKMTHPWIPAEAEFAKQADTFYNYAKRATDGLE